MVVYIDSVFIINFVINYVLILVTAKICAEYVKRYRIILSAFAGALYSVFATLERTGTASHFLIKIAVCVLMMVITFFDKKFLLRKILVFCSVSAGFAGVVMAVSLLGYGDISGGNIFQAPRFSVLLISFAAAYVVFTVIFKKMGKSRINISEMTVWLDGRKVKFKALQDTGNSLSDPMTGRSAAVTDVHTVAPLFDKVTADVIKKVNSGDAVSVFEKLIKTGSRYKFCLVPYKAVGMDSGMLLAFTPDEVLIDGRREDGIIIAISPNSVSDTGTYSALISST